MSVEKKVSRAGRCSVVRDGQLKRMSDVRL